MKNLLIALSLTTADSAWLKKETTRSIAISGYLCYHQIFIHTLSRRVNRVLRKLELIQQEFEGVEIDEEIWKILEGLEGEKVVVISECTC